MKLKEETKYIKDEVDKEIVRYSKTELPISCGAKCPFCCHVQVSVFKEEVDNIISLGVEIDMDHLEGQNKDWRTSNKTCVFIKEGNCSIHDNRPLACVNHMVNSPVENCKEGNLNNTHFIRSRTATERLKELRKGKEVLFLHKELHRIINGN